VGTHTSVKLIGTTCPRGYWTNSTLIVAGGILKTTTFESFFQSTCLHRIARLDRGRDIGFAASRGQGRR
jgi:hypothetical protein